MEMTDCQGNIFSITLTMGEYGWCSMIIEHGHSQHVIHLSDVSDPFKDFIYWISDLTSTNESSILIDEGGHQTTIYQKAINNTDTEITMIGSHRNKVFVSVAVNKEWFAAQMHDEIKRFFSEDFDPLHWDKCGFEFGTPTDADWDYFLEDGLKEWVLKYYA